MGYVSHKSFKLRPCLLTFRCYFPASLEINEDLTKIKTSLNHLKTLQTNISTTLNDTKNKIDTACSGNPCNLDTSGLVFNPDFSTVSPFI